jgi:hypothetical protein
MSEEKKPTSEVTYSGIDSATVTVSAAAMLPPGYRFKPAEPVCDEKGNIVDWRYMGIEKTDPDSPPHIVEGK